MTGNSVETAGSRAQGAASRRQRACLGCRAPFPSAGPHERICPRCKESEDWLAGAVEHACHAGETPRPATVTG